MTFVDGFYSFALDISDSNRNIYRSTRIKTPKHPNETHQLLIARLLAFVHSFKDSLKFSHGLFEIDQPTIWEKDAIAEITEWIQVGELPFKKLQRAVRRHHNATFKVYFYQEQQLEQFSKGIKGTKNEWLSDIQFYMIPETFLEEAIPHLNSSNRLQVSLLDNHFYLTFNSEELSTQISSIEGSTLAWRSH